MDQVGHLAISTVFKNKPGWIAPTEGRLRPFVKAAKPLMAADLAKVEDQLHYVERKGEHFYAVRYAQEGCEHAKIKNPTQTVMVKFKQPVPEALHGDLKAALERVVPSAERVKPEQFELHINNGAIEPYVHYPEGVKPGVSRLAEEVVELAPAPKKIRVNPKFIEAAEHAGNVKNLVLGVGVVAAATAGLYALMKSDNKKSRKEREAFDRSDVSVGAIIPPHMIAPQWSAAITLPPLPELANVPGH